MQAFFLATSFFCYLGSGAEHKILVAFPPSSTYLEVFGETEASSAEEQLARDNRTNVNRTGKVEALWPFPFCFHIFSLTTCLRKPKTLSAMHEPRTWPKKNGKEQKF